MKKLFTSLLALALSAVMLLSLAACGDEADTASTDTASSSSTQTVSQEESGDGEVSSESNGTTASGKFATIEDYINSEEMKAELDSMIDMMEGLGMKIEVLGDGDKLIYRYTYNEQMPADTLADTLLASLDAQASTFESVASSLKLLVEVEDPIVVVEYYNADGTEICSKEFTAND